MIQSHKLINKYGNTVEIINYGARIGSILLNTIDGPINICLSYDDLQDYITDPFFLGASIGRYANRLKDEKGNILLHGGKTGFHSKYWDILSKSQSHITLRYISKDGEEGFLGTLSISVTFLWSDENSLTIKYSATTNAKTVINLTSHPYFNLDGNGDIDQHKIQIFADQYTVTDNDLVPTGKISNVEDGNLDYRNKKTINQNEVDHNFILSDQNELKHAASVSSSNDQIGLDVYTNQPGLQFYTGHALKAPFNSRSAFCLEAQNFPDAPNHRNFPSAELKPGEIYTNVIKYDLKMKQ